MFLIETLFKTGNNTQNNFVILSGNKYGSFRL